MPVQFHSSAFSSTPGILVSARGALVDQALPGVLFQAPLWAGLSLSHSFEDPQGLVHSAQEILVKWLTE